MKRRVVRRRAGLVPPLFGHPPVGEGSFGVIVRIRVR